MATNLIHVRSEYLQYGMYVADIDPRWAQTTLPAHGFLITRRSQIDSLQLHCRFALIDPERSDPRLLTRSASHPEISANGVFISSSLIPTRQKLRELVSSVARAVRNARRLGTIEVDALDWSAQSLVTLTEQAPDASLWLLMTEHRGGLLHRRAVGTAALAVMFGRRLGFRHAVLCELALGGLLLDVGKMAVPMSLLVKPKSLSPIERNFVNQHVSKSMTMLRRDAEIPRRAIEMVLGHHERFDGSGYPRKLAGSAIPLVARIAGIADTFDALTRNRHYAAGMSGHGALRFLNTLRGQKFDHALVTEFVHTVGIYPTGTGVELTDGAIGIVCGQNPDWPLQPHVVLVRNGTGERIEPWPVLDGGIQSRIARTLPLKSLQLSPGEAEAAFQRNSDLY